MTAGVQGSGATPAGDAGAEAPVVTERRQTLTVAMRREILGDLAREIGAGATVEGDRLMLDAGQGVTLEGHVEPDGTIVVRTADGTETQAIGRLQLIRFPNPQGLLAAGQGRWLATDAAGPPETGVPGQATWPPVLSGVREHSNVDLVDQMTQLIMAQRAYTANLRALQTIDELVEIATRLRQ